jgi:hypothetical protein
LSGDDVGDEHVFQQRKFVAQLELALLETLQLDHVDIGHLAQRLDRCIKVTMIASGDFDSRPNFGLFHAIRSLAADWRCRLVTPIGGAAAAPAYHNGTPRALRRVELSPHHR